MVSATASQRVTLPVRRRGRKGIVIAALLLCFLFISNSSFARRFEFWKIADVYVNHKCITVSQAVSSQRAAIKNNCSRSFVIEDITPQRDFLPFIIEKPPADLTKGTEVLGPFTFDPDGVDCKPYSATSWDYAAGKPVDCKSVLWTSDATLTVPFIILGGAVFIKGADLDISYNIVQGRVEYASSYTNLTTFLTFVVLTAIVFSALYACYRNAKPAAPRRKVFKLAFLFAPLVGLSGFQMWLFIKTSNWLLGPLISAGVCWISFCIISMFNFKFVSKLLQRQSKKPLYIFWSAVLVLCITWFFGMYRRGFY